MESPGSSEKHKTADAAASPPLAKRVLQSGTTKSAVAQFFTPASQKPKERTAWSQRAPRDGGPATLLVGRYDGPSRETERARGRRKIAAFDLDSTLITKLSGKKNATSDGDWKWWDSCVPGKLRQLQHEQGYQVVILSNQAGLTLHFDAGFKGPKAAAQKRLGQFKQKCSAVLANLDLPTTLYAATGRDEFRKPRSGMWKEVCDDYATTDQDVDMTSSFFVGDAGGRVADVGVGRGKSAPAGRDFSCSDRNFAQNVGIAYKTPEEFFLGHEPRAFCRDLDLGQHPFADDSADSGLLFERKNDKDLVLFCGPPGAGKSTFYWKHLEPLGYERVNQDTLKSREKCVRMAKELLAEGSSVAVDNTNADSETRVAWVELAKEAGTPIRCLWFRTPLHVCEHNDAVRANNTKLNPEARPSLPKLAFNGFVARFKEPKTQEGFQDVTAIDFKFRGTKDEYDVWGRYWI